MTRLAAEPDGATLLVYPRRRPALSDRRDPHRGGRQRCRDADEDAISPIMPEPMLPLGLEPLPEPTPLPPADGRLGRAAAAAAGAALSSLFDRLAEDAELYTHADRGRRGVPGARSRRRAGCRAAAEIAGAADAAEPSRAEPPAEPPVDARCADHRSRDHRICRRSRRRADDGAGDRGAEPLDDHRPRLPRAEPPSRPDRASRACPRVSRRPPVPEPQSNRAAGAELDRRRSMPRPMRKPPSACRATISRNWAASSPTACRGETDAAEPTPARRRHAGRAAGRDQPQCRNAGAQPAAAGHPGVPRPAGAVRQPRADRSARPRERREPARRRHRLDLSEPRRAPVPGR